MGGVTHVQRLDARRSESLRQHARALEPLLRRHMQVFGRSRDDYGMSADFAYAFESSLAPERALLFLATQLGLNDAQEYSGTGHFDHSHQAPAVLTRDGLQSGEPLGRVRVAQQNHGGRGGNVSENALTKTRVEKGRHTVELVETWHVSNRLHKDPELFRPLYK